MAIWQAGKVEEYANGFLARVYFEKGHYAVLREEPSEWVNGPCNYFIAYAEREDRGYGDFPWCFAEERTDGVMAGSPKLYSNLVTAVANLIRLSEEGKTA